MYRRLINITLCSFVLIMSCAFAKNPFSVKISFYNQTGAKQSFSGHPDGYYQDMNITPAANQSLSEKITEPLVMQITPEEHGKMFRLKYDLGGNKGCSLDFVISWNTPKNQYMLRNLHVSNGENYTCPVSPVKIRKDQNQAQFSLALTPI